MNLITVVPISRQKLPPQLTYFTAKDVPVGAVVSIPVRSKSIPAIVTEARTAADLKTEIRNAPYEIKKLGSVRATSFFSPSFIEACRELSDFYATTVGAVIGTAVSDIILSNTNRIAPPLPMQQAMADINADIPTESHETYAIQGDEDDRMGAWRSLIRQQFARKKSVAIYVPTIQDARQIYSLLEKGIEGYIHILHGSLTKKKALETWAGIADSAHPVVVIATPYFPVLPRSNIDNIVIERENGRGWMTMKSPYLDLRRVMETIGRRSGASVHLADSLLRVDTLHRLEEHAVAHGNPFKWRSISTATDSLISMRIESPETGKTAPFRILSDEVLATAKRNREENSSMFIMASRRGLATLTVCDDCERLVSCDKCGTPLVLHVSKQTGKNFYMCHACGERSTAELVCAGCGGHRLSAMGIGVERVKQELKRKLPDIDTVQVDADSTKTEKQVADAIARWRSKPGSILIGTETALHHLGGQADHVAVASLDSLFALPDFRIEERLMYTLLRLRASASKTLAIQTRRPTEKVFEYALKGNLSDFYRSVMAERRKFDYPPFSHLIKVTIQGKKSEIAEEMGQLQQRLAPHDINVFPAFTSSERGTSMIHGLIKISEDAWPDQSLTEKLRVLKPNISIKIDPESLL